MIKFTPANNCDEFVGVPHEFFETLQAYVKFSDGKVVLTGYGIGEIVYVKEPAIQLLVSNDVIITNLELFDGSVILDIPENLNLKRVWGMNCLN